MKLLGKIFDLLDKPYIYNLSQKLLASNGTKAVTAILMGHIKNRSYDKVLDVGCGTGKYTNLFKGKDYIGVDNNLTYLDYVSKKYPWARFIPADVSSLPFPSNFFDYVFCVSTCHHLTDQKLVGVLEEMKRVCKNRGLVYVIDNVYPSRLNFLGYILFKLDRGKFQRTFKAMEFIMFHRGLEVVTPDVKGGFPYRYAVFMFRKKSV